MPVINHGSPSLSLHLLLSIVKEESFDLRDARIRTRDLEYRNQTWSVRIRLGFTFLSV
jgi:hypothetical protein